MSLNKDEINEFKLEAVELIEEAEKCLLEVEQGQAFKPRYDAIFRCFHSLKGAAGMLGLEELRNHMHQLEEMFARLKDSAQLSSQEISFFLTGIDASRKILNGEKVAFDFKIAETGAPKEAPISQKVDVFIIDDEEDLVDVLGSYMTKANLIWKGFTDPLKAVEEFQHNLPRLVISDIKMPKLDGIGVLKKLREVTKEVPLIIVSAQLSKEALMEAVSQGISAVIEKPFRESQVMFQVHQALHQADLNELLNKTIDLLMFQMPDLEKFLIQTNKQDMLNILKADISQLLTRRRELRRMIKPPER